MCLFWRRTTKRVRFVGGARRIAPRRRVHDSAVPRGIERRHFKTHTVLRRVRISFSCAALRALSGSCWGDVTCDAACSTASAPGVRGSPPAQTWPAQATSEPSMTRPPRATRVSSFPPCPRHLDLYRTTPRLEQQCSVQQCAVQTAARVRGSCDARFAERASEEAHRVRERRKTTREERARGMAR